MRKRDTANGGTPELDREPDLVLEVLSWESELLRTAMFAKAYGDKKERPKFLRKALVRNPDTDKQGVLNVVGTMGQWQNAVSDKVAGFFSKDKKDLYLQPIVELEEAANDASSVV